MSNTTKPVLQINYGNESIPRLFISVVIPSIIAMIIIGAQSIIDGMFLGNFIGSHAMSSANIASPFLQISFGISFVIGTGSTAFIGRCLGTNDIYKAQNIFKTCFYTLVCTSSLILIIGYFRSEQIALLFGASETLLSSSAEYIKTLSLFIPFIMLYLFFAFANRAIGKPQLLLYSSFACVLFNIIFNYIFIVVLDLNMTGAALATSLSFLIGFLINIKPLLSRTSIINLYMGSFNLKLLGTVVYNGASEGVTSTSIAVTTLLFNLTFMHYYGDLGVASFATVNYIGQFVCNLLFGIADGITPIISYNIGANLHTRVKKIMSISVISNFLIGLIVMILVHLRGDTLIRLFSDANESMISMTFFGAKLYAISFLFAGFNILLSAYYTAKGDAFSSAIISASRGLVFIILGIFTLPFIFGVTGVWLVIPFADITTMFICMYIYKKKE